MLKQLLTIILIGGLSASATVMAQKAPKVRVNDGDETPDNMRAFNTMRQWGTNGNIETGDLLRGLNPPPPEVIGDVYLDSEWKVGNVLMFQDNMTIEDYPLRYDLYNDMLEIDTDEGVKVLEAHRIKSFAWRDSNGKPVYYLGSRNYRSETEELNGFFEIMADGEVPLLRKTNIRVKEPDYYEGIDIGSRDYEIQKSDEYYYAIGRVVYELKRSKKGVLEAFADREDEMSAFFKKENIVFKKDGDLALAFTYYNNLISEQ